FGLIKNLLKVFVFISYSTLFERKKPFLYAKYAPLLFKHKIGDEYFNMFQTLEVTNFEASFCKKDIDLLINESGVCIAHCYFSSPLKHQKGKLFYKSDVSPKNEENFKYLGEKIKDKAIWNPTLIEFSEFYNEILDMGYHIDSETGKVIENNSKVPIKYISYV